MAKARGKVAAERRHARRRAFERYGLEMGNASRIRIIRAIQGGGARFVRRQSHRVTVWDVEDDGVIVRVVYDAKRHELVTFLPR